jgi:hypothetical protein
MGHIEALTRSIDAMERKNRQGQRQQASRAPGVGPYDRLGGCGSTPIPAPSSQGATLQAWPPTYGGREMTWPDCSYAQAAGNLNVWEPRPASPAPARAHSC